MNKIVVVGSGGAGKSTLSIQLSSILNIPVYHLDKYFWRPDWKMINMNKWFEVNEKLIK
jgi:adenylate kinase family enzyme